MPENPLKHQDIYAIINSILDYVLPLAALIAVAFIMYGGFEYITSGGSEEKAKKGMHAVTYAVVGLVLVFAAYAIKNTVCQTIGVETVCNFY